MAMLNILILLSSVVALGNTNGVEEQEDWGCGRSCPSGWTEYNSYCYIYNSTARTWSQAEQYCLSLGGNLVSIHNAGENEAVKDVVFRATNSNPAIWIGGSDLYETKVWFWSDGTTFDYSNWSSGEPNNGRGGIEHCGQTNYKGAGYWNDRTCESRLPCVCKLRHH
ncbi:ladderlectin-like isoform X1 [Esox lucius]|uniref:C-type lectin domain-containing protein n=1 Tax=Esox lucius TaxID=8010 RepID=A0A3P8XZY1_ESOLU|nr:ladderlectin-like isoform X1 [Esox lucius]XP_019912109.1 ladderlectin-like isoform X1 [Esox lucius]